MPFREMSCPICDDTGWKAIDDHGVRRVIRCDCWKAGVASSLLGDARVPARYNRCDFTTFETNFDSHRQAHRKAVEFADRFPVVDRGLLFYGPPGVGKTHLAVAILKECIRRKSARGKFYETSELLRLLRETYGTGTRVNEMDILRPVMESDLVVLDDLGQEKTSDWVQETIGLIINTRYASRKPTIITTNLVDSSDLTDPNSIACRVGLRTRSRLLEMCDWVHMAGHDVREIGPHPTADELARYQANSPAAHTGGGRKPSTRSQVQDVKPRGQLKSRIPTGKDPRIELKWTGGKAGT
jgi:DNA replication protein DnaC